MESKPTPSSSTGPSAKLLQDVEQALENLSQTLFEMEEKASHVFPGQEEFMMDTTELLIKHFGYVGYQAYQLGPDFTVPKSAVKEVDEGRNPQLWTQRALMETLAENQLQKGKLEGLESYSSAYAQALREQFPDLASVLPPPVAQAEQANGATEEAAAQANGHGTSSSVGESQSQQQQVERPVEAMVVDAP